MVWYLYKKIFDHLGYAINSGEPLVNHTKSSNIWNNLEKELQGLRINENLWEIVDGIKLRGETIVDCYKEIAINLEMPGEYWEKLKEAMLIWVSLFEGMN